MLRKRELLRAMRKRERLTQAQRYLEETLPNLIDLPTTHGAVQNALATVSRNLAKADKKIQALEDDEAVS